MSLARLLTAAKALTRFSESPSAYRMRRGVTLPKFGGVSDPFASDKKPATLGASEQTIVAPVAAGGTARRRFWPWKLGRGPQGPAAHGKPALATKSGPALAARIPVQGELTLDKVRVARNDLRDSDVEVVARTGDRPPSRPAVAANLMLGALAAEKALDRLADRITGAEAR